MTSTEIQKFDKYTTAKLIQKCQLYFNRFIRARDKDTGCISCGSWANSQAGHYMSAGHHSSLRFNEDNVNRQCLKCNNYLHGNLINYRIGLVKRIGEDRVKALEETPRQAHRWDRFTLIEKILHYKTK